MASRRCPARGLKDQPERASWSRRPVQSDLSSGLPLKGPKSTIKAARQLANVEPTLHLEGNNEVWAVAGLGSHSVGLLYQEKIDP